MHPLLFDIYSWKLILLTLLILLISLLVLPFSRVRVTSLEREKIALLLFITTLLFFLLLTGDILYFYILFELSVIPVYLLIYVWGGREERGIASHYLILYTLIRSIPLLISLLSLQIIFRTTLLRGIEFSLLPSLLERNWIWSILFRGLLLPLLIKLPIYPFHLWLPQAHVEAPLIRSLLLARIFLKIGGYRILRFLSPLLSENIFLFAPLLYLLRLCNILYRNLNTARQVDRKKLIAYSSVGHMRLIILLLLLKCREENTPALFIMIAHRFSSSALFLIAATLYNRFSTRILHYWRNISLAAPFLRFTLLISLLSSIRFPRFFSFLREFISFSLLILFTPIIGLFASLRIFISAV